jgi:hypothetical protein
VIDPIPRKVIAGYPIKPTASIGTPQTVQRTPPGVIIKTPIMMTHAQAKYLIIFMIIFPPNL